MRTRWHSLLTNSEARLEMDQGKADSAFLLVVDVAVDEAASGFKAE